MVWIYFYQAVASWVWILGECETWDKSHWIPPSHSGLLILSHLSQYPLTWNRLRWMLVVGTGKAMAPHSSTLAWKIPWMEEPGRLQSMGSLRVGQDWAISLSLFTFTFLFHALEKEMATHSSVLAWRIPGTGEPGGLPSMGSHRVRHDWSDLAVAVVGNVTKG